MANNRTNIRQAIASLLSGQTDAGTNIYTNRETTLWRSELPAILIFTSQEPATPENLSQRRYIRDLELIIQVKIEETSAIDDDIDEIVADIEAIMDANPSLSGTVLSTVQKNTEIRIDSDGEKNIGVAILTFECKYIA